MQNRGHGGLWGKKVLGKRVAESLGKHGRILCPAFYQYFFHEIQIGRQPFSAVDPGKDEIFQKAHVFP
jgi:hypothetical protein